MNYNYAPGDGSVEGPVSIETLFEMLEKGQATENFRVAPEGTTDWVPLSSLLVAGAPTAAPVVEDPPAAPVAVMEPETPAEPEPIQPEPEPSVAVQPVAHNPVADQLKESDLQVVDTSRKPKKSSNPVVNLLCNLLWFIPGSIMWLCYVIAGIFSCLTIIGIASGMQSFKLAGYALWPFGKRIELTQSAGGCIATLGNIIWFLVGGWWLALLHLCNAVFLAIFIITIPFAKTQYQMAKLALSPYGRRIVKS